jgi:hypothetical protein
LVEGRNIQPTLPLTRDGSDVQNRTSPLTNV